jgi:hypothetical protein
MGVIIVKDVFSKAERNCHDRLQPFVPDLSGRTEDTKEET